MSLNFIILISIYFQVLVDTSSLLKYHLNSDYRSYSYWTWNQFFYKYHFNLGKVEKKAIYIYIYIENGKEKEEAVEAMVLVSFSKPLFCLFVCLFVFWSIVLENVFILVA